MRKEPQVKNDKRNTGPENSNISLKEIVDRSPAVAFIWLAAEGWPVIFVSENIRQFGYTPSDFYSGRIPFASIVHPDDLERVSTEVREYSGQGLDEFSQEYRIVTADGQVRWLDDRTWVKRDAKGVVISYQGVVLDISKRKAVEEALKLHEQQLSLITDNMADVVARLDADLKFIYISPSASILSGYKTSDLLGKSVRSLIHPDDLEMVIHETGTARKKQLPGITLEYRQSNSDGKYRWVESKIQMLYDDQGNSAGSVICLRDITDRKQSEVALRESEEKFRSIVENSLAGIFKVDDSFHFVYANDEFCRILDYPREQLLGMNFQDGLSEESRAMVVDRYIRRQRGEIISPRYELVIKRKDGECRDIEMIVSVVKDSTGKPGTMGQIVDITERKRVEEASGRRLKRLEVLRTINNAITASLDLRHTLSIFLDQLQSQLAIDAADIQLFNPHQLAFNYASGIGLNYASRNLTVITPESDPIGEVAHTRQMVQIPNLYKWSEFNRKQAFLREGFISYFGLPLTTKGELRGVLEIFHREQKDYDSEWVDFLESLARQAAISIDNATLFDELQRSNLELTLAYDATIEGWSRALDLRDEGTGGHTHRVTELTLKLAKEMGIDDDELIHIRRGAMLHDIGKMGIPDEILHKPGKLTDEEWVIMKRHPEYAFDMLSSIRYLKASLNIPYCHHEKWDGTGYPRGLKGEIIPLEARLFAVVDVWDALVSVRHRREAWSKEKALKHIREQSGKHFDPDIVKAFMKIIKSELKN